MHETIVRANSSNTRYLSELWAFRELFLFLAWRDILIRYKQTVFGIAWAVIRPLLTMIVFTIIFGRLAKLPSYDIPYPLLVFSGVLAWQFFATSFVDSSNSLVVNVSMISKIYFPRMIVPLSSIGTGVVDTIITSIIYICFSTWYGFLPDWHILFLPLFILLLFVFIFAISLWFSTLNVSYRDFRYIIPFIVQLGAYISPVGFVSNVVPEKWLMLYSLNPLVGIIDGFRWCLLRGSTPLDLNSVLISIFITLLLLIPGFFFFKRKERFFADVV